MILSSTDAPSAGIAASSSLPGVRRRTSVGARHAVIVVVTAAGENDRARPSHTAMIEMAAAAPMMRGRI